VRLEVCVDRFRRRAQDATLEFGIVRDAEWPAEFDSRAVWTTRMSISVAPLDMAMAAAIRAAQLDPDEPSTGARINR